MDIHADAYAIGLYRDCQRKYNLRINENLVTKGVSPGRGFGSILHKGREVWKLGLMQGLSNSEAYNQGLNALELEWKGAFGQGVQVDERRSLENATRLFHGYVSKFVSHAYTPLYVEVPFDLHIGTSPAGNEVYRTGIIDELCEFNGRRYVLDFKTSTLYPGGAWFDGWRTNDQFMGYLFASRKLYGDVHGVIVHGVWVHTPPKTTRGKYKFEDYFTADIITFTDAQLDEWRTWFLQTCDERDRSRTSNLWQPNWNSACKAYGSTCDYFKWCSADSATRPMIEKIYYDKVQWTPLASERLQEVGDGTETTP